MKEITKFERQQCDSCQFRMFIDGRNGCNYLEITGAMRPSPAGSPCMEYIKGKQIFPNNKTFRDKGFKSDDTHYMTRLKNRLNMIWE